MPSGAVDRADVVVVGAGPAGAAAAITLAKAGRDVVVVDRARFPRDKCCGDGLTTLALRWLERLGLAPAAVPSWFDVETAWVRSPSGRTVGFPLPTGQGRFAAVTPRFELDAALLDLARAAGAKVHDGCGFTALEDHGDHVTVEVGGLGTLEAGHVIGADGTWSPVRKALGLSETGQLGEWYALRQYFTGVTGSAAERLWIWFERDLLPGYAWSFPLPDGRANVGFGVLRDGTRKLNDLTRLWHSLLVRPHVLAALGAGARPESAHRAWPIPARIDRSPLGRGRTLLVGDAAAATDVLTGEGIGQALLTGALAAEAIVAHGLAASAGPEAALTAYRTQVRAELVADHRMSAGLGRILRSTAGARGAVRVAGASAWTRRNFARWLFEDEPRAIVFTPRRWHRRFLAQPGAYPDRVGELSPSGHVAEIPPS